MLEKVSKNDHMTSAEKSICGIFIFFLPHFYHALNLAFLFVKYYQINVIFFICYVHNVTETIVKKNNVTVSDSNNLTKVLSGGLACEHCGEMFRTRSQKILHLSKTHSPGTCMLYEYA